MVEYYKKKIQQIQSEFSVVETKILNHKSSDLNDFMTEEEYNFFEKFRSKYDRNTKGFKFRVGSYFPLVDLIFIVTYIYLAIISLINETQGLGFIAVVAYAVIILFYLASFIFVTLLIIDPILNIILQMFDQLIRAKKWEKYWNLEKLNHDFEQTKKFQNSELEELQKRTVELKLELTKNVEWLNEAEESQRIYDAKQQQLKEAERLRRLQEQEDERLRRIQEEEAEQLRQIQELAAERLRQIQRKKESYWFDMNGYQFEDEVASLLRANGYLVQPTSYSGDGGADLILKDQLGRKIVVQCKNFAKPASPSIARDLLGTIKDFDADYGMLVCSGGFTSGTINFANRNSIKLLDVKDLVLLAEKNTK